MVSEVTVTGFLGPGALDWTAEKADGDEIAMRKREAAMTKAEEP